MTYFQDDNGNTIELPEDFSFYSSAADLFNFSIKGSISTSFKVPNNSYFKGSFQYYSPLQSPSQGFNATYYSLVKNGNILFRGKLCLEREDDDWLYFFFIGGNANWMNAIQGKLKEFDYDEFKITWTNANIASLAGATSGFCFPLIDWAYQYKKLAGYFYTRIVDTNQDVQKSYSDFYPCFFLKSAMQHIFKKYQLQMGGDVLNDPVYQQMIITPDDGEIKRAPKFLKDRQTQVTLNSNQALRVDLSTNISFSRIIYDGSLLSFNNTAPAFYSYFVHNNFYIQIDINLTLSDAFPIEIILNNGSSDIATIDNFTTQVTTVPSVQSVSFKSLTIGLENQKNVFEGAVTDGQTLFFKAQIGKTFVGGWNSPSFPTVGSGGGNPLQGDSWKMTGTQTIGGNVCVANSVLVALCDNPGTTLTNWYQSKSLSQLAGDLYIKSDKSIATFSPRENMNDFYNNNDTLRACDILPDIDAIELIKFVCNYFCCIVYFDQATGTVNFNKLDNFKFETALDWSQYLQKRENNYAIKTAQNNFVKFTHCDDPILNTVNGFTGTTLNYGEINIQGLSQSLVNNDLFTIPFGAAVDRVWSAGNIQSPFIGLVELQDSNPLPITSITNNAGKAQFNNSNNTYIPGIIQTQIVRIEGTMNYDGYYVGWFATNNTFYSTATGDLIYIDNQLKGSTAYIYPQTITFKSQQSRILFFVPSYGYIISINGTSTTPIGTAYFSKPTTGASISSYKQGLNVGNISFFNYQDVPRFLDNFKILTRILQSPYIKLWIYLPEEVYASFNFSNFVYIKDEEQQRYLLVDAIQNYKDSKTLVEIDGYLIV